MASASASPFPEKRVPSSGESRPRRRRFLSSRRDDPSVPAARTSTGASTSPSILYWRSANPTRQTPPVRSGGSMRRTSCSGETSGPGPPGGATAGLCVRMASQALEGAGRGEDGEVLHQAQVEHPAGIENVVPEGEWRLLRAIRKVAWTEATAALEHANSPAPLGQAASGHSSAEAGAHHDRVVDALHGTHLTSQRRIGQGRISEVAELSFSR